MQDGQQRKNVPAGRIEVLSRQLTSAGLAEVAPAAPSAYRLQAQAADVYHWLVRDNVAMREAIFDFLKVSTPCLLSCKHLCGVEVACHGADAVLHTPHTTEHFWCLSRRTRCTSLTTTCPSASSGS